MLLATLMCPLQIDTKPLSLTLHATNERFIHQPQCQKLPYWPYLTVSLTGTQQNVKVSQNSNLRQENCHNMLWLIQTELWPL